MGSHARAAVLLGGLGGCLIAPPRPSDGSDGGDAGTDANSDGVVVPACEPTDESLLHVIAVVPGLAGDTLIRAGADRGGPHLYLYRPGPDPLRVCADQWFPIPAAGLRTARVTAVGVAGPDLLYVLVSGGDPNMHRMFEVRIDPASVSAPLPLDIDLGLRADGTPPYVVYRTNDPMPPRLLVGAGNLYLVDISHGWSMASATAATVEPPVTDPILLAVSRTTDDANPIDLAGEERLHRLGVGLGGVLLDTPSTPRFPGDCAPGACAPQFARATTELRAAGDLYTHLVARPTGVVSVPRPQGTDYLEFEMASPVRDAAVGLLSPDMELDAVALVGGSAPALELAVPGVDTHSVAELVGDSDRVILGTFRPERPVSILTLSIRPRGPAATEQCFEVDHVGMLRPCSP
jgi:hypothetical protein